MKNLFGRISNSKINAYLSPLILTKGNNLINLQISYYMTKNIRFRTKPIYTLCKKSFFGGGKQNTKDYYSNFSI